MSSVFSLSELAEAWTNEHPDDLISPRTLRYYISVALIEGPGRVGPGKHYGERHLKRLEVIRLMQENGRTIDEIRSLLAGLETNKIPDVIQEQKKLLQARKDAEQRLLGSSFPVDEELAKVDTNLSNELPNAGKLLTGIKPFWRKRESSKQEPLEGLSWIRFNITPGLEVLIREDLMTKKGDDVLKWMREGSALLATGYGRNEKASTSRTKSEETNE